MDINDKYANMTDEKFNKMHANDPVLSKVKTLQESDLLKVLNGAYIAKRFFGKSRSWFSQKLNHSIKNGKPAAFTKEELEILRNAIDVITIELEGLADDLLD